MIFYIKIITLIFSFQVKADTMYKDCTVNPIYCQIIQNSPKIDQNYALELAQIINSVAIELNLKPYRLAAILKQESNYKLDAVNHKSKDYGIAQINHKTIQAYNFNKELLLTDLQYSIKAGAIVLSDFKRMYSHKEEFWWSRYNSSNPVKREQYKQFVLRYM